MRGIFLIGLATLALTATAQPVVIGAATYFAASDSPFKDLPGFTLEDVEDDQFNVPGVTSDFWAYSDVFGTQTVDSVDADDGIVNGTGINGPLGAGNSLYGRGQIQFWFHQAKLPTHVGLVWTDGAGKITFEGYDQIGSRLVSVNGFHADGDFLGRTQEDRFYGLIHEGGISSVRIYNAQGHVEVDHFQFATVPEIEGIWALFIGLSAFVVGRRRKSYSRN